MSQSIMMFNNQAMEDHQRFVDEVNRQQHQQFVDRQALQMHMEMHHGC